MSKDKSKAEETKVEEVVEAEATEEATTDKTLIKCRLLRDRWNEDGVRVVAGTEVDLPVEVAMDAIEAKAVERVK